MTPPERSSAALVDDLRALGIEDRSQLVVHSSLRSMGRIPGGPDQVVECLLQVVGDDGLVMAPTFTYTSTRFDPARTPARTGAIAEALRQHPRALRSFHPFYSVAGIGPSVETLLAGHEQLPGTALDSPLDRLAESGGLVLLLGVGHVANTTVHVGEFRAEVPYLDIPFDPTWPRAAEISVGQERARQVAYERFPGCSRAFGTVEHLLRRRAVVSDGRVGHAPAQLLAGKDVIDVTVELLAEDPGGLLCSDRRCYRCMRARERLR